MNHFKEKSKRLEKLRGIYFQIGLIMAGGLALLAFEWTFPTHISDLGGIVVEEIEEDYFFDENFTIIKEVKKEFKIEQPKVDLTRFTPVDKKVVEPIEPVINPEPNFDPTKYATKEPVIDEPAPLPLAEVMPEFKGGLEKLFEYLGNNLKYPASEKNAGIQGTVYLQFVVGKKGEIKDVKILRGVSKLIDKEALRVLKAMPRWKPGKQSGRTVSVIYNLPIKFKIKG